jgi:hypothetical protein
MRVIFVPSYYARDMLNKMLQLRQGAKSVEEYYQELQMGMLRCNLEEEEESAMARFLGGLNHEIQDILAYKDYTNITCLFHLACKAEREVQRRRASAKTNSWQPRTTTRTPMPSSSDEPRVTPANSVTKIAPTPAASATSMASTGRTKDVQCHRCKGYGHVIRDCPSKRVMVIKDDGEYSSASDFDEDTFALLAANHVGSEGHLEEHIDAGEADRYESLIVQRVFSAQMEKAEQNQ